jgi:hypothetical protein
MSLFYEMTSMLIARSDRVKSYCGPDDEPIGVGSSPDVRLVGEWRHPMQLLQDQELTSGPTVHDEAVAASLNLSGAPIEGPTHFSQFGPLAMSLCGDEWLATGCISTHFTAPVTEGKATRAEVVAAPGAQRAVITMQADDDRQVLTGGISVAGQEQGTVCRHRLTRAQRPDEMQILDQGLVGMASDPLPARLTFAEPVGPPHPSSLDRKLEVITESHPSYRSADNPWGAPIIPLEILAVLLHEHSQVERIPVSRQAVGLFLDQEIEVHHGPVLVGEEYLIQRPVGPGRSTGSMWLRSSAIDHDGRLRVTMLLHIGFLRSGVGTAAAAPSVKGSEA